MYGFTDDLWLVKLQIVGYGMVDVSHVTVCAALLVVVACSLPTRKAVLFTDCLRERHYKEANILSIFTVFDCDDCILAKTDLRKSWHKII